ncbi:MAG: hypothetical protein WCA38_20225 [Candidatus Acidiferrales bacterium]
MSNSAGFPLRKMSVRIFAVAALLLVSPLLSPSYTRAVAQSDDKAARKDKIVVLAHLQVPGSAVRQILTQNEKGKQYLLLQQNTHFTVVDVTDPKNPQIVDRTAGQGKLTEVGAGLAISVQSDKPLQDNPSTQTVRLVDLSDPKNPRTVKTLNGVTSLYSDDGRQLIYATNNEGLWIIKHYETFRLPMCTSDSYDNTVAQCQ